MKNYIEYFEPGGNVRYIKRYVTEKPEGKEEIPLTTDSGFIPWLIRKFKSNATKTSNVKPAEVNTPSYGNIGRKYVVDVYPNSQQLSDTISAGPHTIIINHKRES